MRNSAIATTTTTTTTTPSALSSLLVVAAAVSSAALWAVSPVGAFLLLPPLSSAPRPGGGGGGGCGRPTRHHGPLSAAQQAIQLSADHGDNGGCVFGSVLGSNFGHNNLLVAEATAGSDLAGGALGGMDVSDPLLLGVAAAAAVAVGGVLLAASAAKAKSSTSDSAGAAQKKAKLPPPPEPVDVSIPYDAAARLAYRQAVGGDDNDDGSDDFAAFDALYRAAAVAEVAWKAKRARLERAFPGVVVVAAATTPMADEA